MHVLASWDDGSTADLKMADLMQKYNIPTIFYWPSFLSKAKNMAMTSSWLTEGECRQLAGQFEIGSHSATHQEMSKMNIPQISREINDSRKHWQDITGQPINSFAFPKKSINTMVKALLKGAGYTSARTSIPGHLTPGPDPFHIHCTVQVGIDRIEYQNKSWELFADEMIAKADEDSTFYIFGNSWDVEAYNDWENLETLLKKLTGR